MSRVDEHAEMFANRLRKNARRLGRWARRGDIGCYRVYDRDIPEVPLAVDTYEGRLHIAEYERRVRDDGTFDDAWFDRMASAAAETLGAKASDVFVKTRRRQRGADQYERVREQGAEFEVSEGGLHFVVNLSDYLDTGLFLDHRETRRLVREWSAGRRVANLFAYTGSFSVYAAAGGARGTVTLDMSNTYLAWAERNMALNGHTGRNHTFERVDVLALLTDPGVYQRAFDLVVLDPPTFSNSKKMRASFDVQRDQVDLLRRTRKLLAPGGEIVFSTNRRRFDLAPKAVAGCEVEELTQQTVPEDFRQHRPHRCWRIRPRGS